MIISHTNQNSYNYTIITECKTLREFIEKELSRIKNREKKYYKLCLKQDYHGNRNLILYYQDGILKSHHEVGVHFDYRDFIDHEIYENYSMYDITIDNIISVDKDSTDEKDNTNIEENKSTEDIIKEFEEQSKDDTAKDHIRDYYVFNVKNDDIVADMARIITKQDKKISDLSFLVRELIDNNKLLEQKLKWLAGK